MRHQTIWWDGWNYTAEVKPDGTLDHLTGCPALAGISKQPWKAHESSSGIHPNVPPALLTLSFMNCGNVVVEWLSPPLKLAKRHAGRTGRQPVKYAVIQIKAMTRLIPVPEPGEGAEDGKRRVSQEFRLIRGHFKRYEHGKGLFGQHKGTFFFSAHTSGTADRKSRQGGYRMEVGTYETSGA